MLIFAFGFATSELSSSLADEKRRKVTHVNYFHPTTTFPILECLQIFQRNKYLVVLCPRILSIDCLVLTARYGGDGGETNSIVFFSAPSCQIAVYLSPLCVEVTEEADIELP